MRNGKPAQYYLICRSNKAMSDDDRDPNDPNLPLQIRIRPKRSMHANKLMRRLDDLMRQATLIAPGKKVASRRDLRVAPEFGRTTRWPKCPSKMFLDYYKPTWFNQLSDATKFDIAIPFIAFPPNFGHILCTPPHSDEKMLLTELNRWYRAQVLALYNWPEDLPEIPDDLEAELTAAYK
jgi:hypothetical protein